MPEEVVSDFCVECFLAADKSALPYTQHASSYYESFNVNLDPSMFTKHTKKTTENPRMCRKPKHTKKTTEAIIGQQRYAHDNLRYPESTTRDSHSQIKSYAICNTKIHIDWWAMPPPPIIL